MIIEVKLLKNIANNIQKMVIVWVTYTTCQLTRARLQHYCSDLQA